MEVQKKRCDILGADIHPCDIHPCDLKSKLAEACGNEEFERADDINSALVEEEIRATIMLQEVTKTEECRLAAWELDKAEAKEVELSENGAKKFLLVHEVRKGTEFDNFFRGGCCKLYEEKRSSAETPKLRLDVQKREHANGIIAASVCTSYIVLSLQRSSKRD